ncbi:MAG: hypothetical protein BroJett018_16630 [Chloroflexota bacterium]|nr:MAG: hypothetical protein BroJett018_16630 [Chloroflexota bacterium]
MPQVNGKAKIGLEALHTDNVAVLEGRVIFRFRANSFQNRKAVDVLEAALRPLVSDPDELAHVSNFAFLLTMTEAIEFGEVQGSLAAFRDWWQERDENDLLATFQGYLAQELRVLNLWADAHNDRLEELIPSERRPRFMRTKEELAALDDPDSPLAVSGGNGTNASSGGPNSSTSARS